MKQYRSGYRYSHYEYLLLDFYKSIPMELFKFPLDLISIIKTFKNYKLWSYQYYAKKYNISLNDVMLLYKSQSGCVQYDSVNQRYLILFNKNEHPSGRVRFTLAHELSHILLKHCNNIGYHNVAENDFTTNAKSIHETEANIFASMLLAPYPLYENLGIKSPIDVEDTFGLSTHAASIAYRYYTQWKECSFKRSPTNDLIALYKQTISAD